MGTRSRSDHHPLSCTIMMTPSHARAHRGVLENAKFSKIYCLLQVHLAEETLLIKRLRLAPLGVMSFANARSARDPGPPCPSY